MEDYDITIELLIGWHKQRAADCLGTIARHAHAETTAGGADLNGEIPPSSGALAAGH
jgi:hypothetical protein